MAARTRERTLELPCPSVRFEPDFVRRLELFADRIAAARGRRESGAGAAVAGGGHEFVGYRPYRAGEDLRALDWNLLARLDRPFVRVTRRETGERWLVVLDASASMGVGPPGKLQRAAEVCAAIATLALRLSAEVTISVSPEGGTRTRRAIELEKRSDLGDLLAFLESQRAEGGAPERTLQSLALPLRDASRVFVTSDLLSFTPADLLPLARSGRELALVQILAPLELNPELDGGVEWWEPESGERLVLALDEHARASYAVELESRLAAWRTACAERGVSHACSSSALPFEDVLRRSLRGASR
jgi:uncharacterized protein (DUF58 family)